MSNSIPWQIIIANLKEEILSPADQRIYDEWISDAVSQQIEKEIHNIWTVSQLGTSNFNPNKDEAWQKVVNRLNITSETRSNSISISHKMLYRIASVAAILLIAVSSFFYLSVPETKVLIFQHSSLTGKSKMELPDGTHMWLAPHSSAQFYNSFNDANRKINVQGKVYFEVKKDSINPFEIDVFGGKIKVYGTSFNINQNDSTTSVSLLSGTLSYENNKNAPIILKPGQTIEVNNITGNTQIKELDIELETLWARDELRIENKTLGEVCKYLNQWYGVSITATPELQGKHKYRFVVTTEQLDEVLRLMSRIHPLEIRYNKEQVYIN